MNLYHLLYNNEQTQLTVEVFHIIHMPLKCFINPDIQRSDTTLICTFNYLLCDSGNVYLSITFGTGMNDSEGTLTLDFGLSFQREGFF